MVNFRDEIMDDVAVIFANVNNRSQVILPFILRLMFAHTTKHK